MRHCVVCCIALITALNAVLACAQQPSAKTDISLTASTHSALYEQGPNGLQRVQIPTTVAMRPVETFSNLSQLQAIRPASQLTSKAGVPEVIRPGASSGQANPAAAGISAVQTPVAPFDLNQLEFTTQGLPGGLNVPQPTAATKRTFAEFVERQIDAENTIQVIEGRDKQLMLREKPRRLFIPSEKIASVHVITAEQLMVVGNNVGTTTLQLWFPDPQHPDDPGKDRILSYLVVVTPNYDRESLELQQDAAALEVQRKAYERATKTLEKQIKEIFPDSAVKLSLVGNQLIVRGEAKDVVEAAQIYSIVLQHAPSTRGQKIKSDNMHVLFVPGMLRNEEEVDAAKAFLTNAQQERTDVINLLRIPGEQQVMLMVTVAEVSRDAARSVGINFNISKGAAIVGQFTGGLLSATTGSTTGLANLSASIDSGEVLLAIQALRQLNLARSLAEPNLTTLNGRAATFRAGGSFPVPTSVITTGGTAQSVTYVPFGVDLQFTPYILDRNRIRLQLAAEVSTRSSNTTQVSGTSVPSNLDNRRFNTTVELREGQTLAVAGLIQNNFGFESNRVPLWGDLPIIGRTGGLDKSTSAEQELVVLVTPILVHPVERCQGPQLPGSDIFEPGDVEFYLLGHLEGRRSVDYRASVRTDFARQERYIHCNDLYIIGPRGTSYACCKSGGSCCPANRGECPADGAAPAETCEKIAEPIEAPTPVPAAAADEAVSPQH